MEYFYTQEQFDFVRDNCTIDRGELVGLFNKKFGTEKTKMQLSGLCKRKGWLTGRTGRFEKGVASWAAGTKGLLKRNSGSFKKGIRPKNWKPVGSERVHSKNGYILIKTTEPNKWRLKQKVLWEKAHGEIPTDKVVFFKDGNPLNFLLDNLELVTRQELLHLNRSGYGKTPEEYKETLKAIVKVEVKLFELVKTE